MIEPHYFITGIGTDVGKTIASAIITQALQADYWKPIQAGDLENSDTHKVKSWVDNDHTVFHPNAYALKTPMSPDAAAKIDGVKINVATIERPKTENSLVIEGAGGLLVPLNETEMILDLIRPTDKVIVVSKHYLGSINHTLLTIQHLQFHNIPIAGILFNGKANLSTERTIEKITRLPIIGRIPFLEEINATTIGLVAAQLTSKLSAL